MANVIDALKRLERWGSEESVAALKLIEAAWTLGNHIAELVPKTPDPLPRGYAVVLWDRSRGAHQDAKTFLTLCGHPSQTPVWDGRQTALSFAQDIATGWLDEVATWLEERTGEASEATARLRRAAQALAGDAP